MSVGEYIDLKVHVSKKMKTRSSNAEIQHPIPLLHQEDNQSNVEDTLMY